MTNRSKENRIVPRSLLFVLALGLCAVASPAHAQTFPSGTVRIIVPFPAGGATDVLGRVLSVHLQNLWGPPVVSEYRPGAAGLLGTRQVARKLPIFVEQIVEFAGYPVRHRSQPQIELVVLPQLFAARAGEANGRVAGREIRHKKAKYIAIFYAIAPLSTISAA